MPAPVPSAAPAPAKGLQWEEYDAVAATILSQLDESVAFALSQGAGAMAEKISSLSDPLMELLCVDVRSRFASPVHVQQCVALLSKVVNNAKMDSNKRTVQTGRSKVFQSLICKEDTTRRTAYAVLKVAGFVEREAEADGGSGSSSGSGGSYIQWTRNDVSVLSIVGDTLEGAHSALLQAVEAARAWCIVHGA